MSEPVVVVGAGPVGLMLALELGTAGVPTVVLERLPAPREASLGMAINGTVVELLDQRGIMDALREDGMEWPQAHFAHLPLDPSRMREQRAVNVLVPQAQMERHLAERVTGLGIEIRRDHEVVGLEQEAGGVVLHVRTAAGDSTVRCRAVVGCDGTDSTVRTLAGIDFPGVDSPFYGMTGDIEATPDLFGLFGAHQHPGGLFTVAPAGDGIVRVSTGQFGVEPPDRDRPVTVEELRAHIEALTGLTPTLGTPRWLARWHHVTRHAERYRAGSVFLAGDAAHTHFPLGGQALSTGVEDAVDLGWKLAADHHGWAPAELLDTYHEERHPVGARACLTTQAQTALMHPMDRVTPLRTVLAELTRFDDVNEALVRIAGGFDVRYAFDGTHPLTGTRLAGTTLRTPAGPTSVTEILRTGRGILLDLSGGAVPWPKTAAGWADRVDVITAERVADLDAEGLLLRPDGRVAWAGVADQPDEDGLRAALSTWFGAPA